MFLTYLCIFSFKLERDLFYSDSLDVLIVFSQDFLYSLLSDIGDQFNGTYYITSAFNQCLNSNPKLY